jgi:hypothetical protein
MASICQCNLAFGEPFLKLNLFGFDTGAGINANYSDFNYANVNLTKEMTMVKLFSL